MAFRIIAIGALVVAFSATSYAGESKGSHPCTHEKSAAAAPADKAETCEGDCNKAACGCASGMSAGEADARAEGAKQTAAAGKDAEPGCGCQHKQQAEPQKK
jgi:hypothetical protein